MILEADFDESSNKFVVTYANTINNKAQKVFENCALKYKLSLDINVNKAKDYHKIAAFNG